MQVQRIWAGYDDIVGRGVGPLTLNKIGRSAFAVIILLPNNAANSFSAACWLLNNMGLASTSSLNWTILQLVGYFHCVDLTIFPQMIDKDALLIRNHVATLGAAAKRPVYLNGVSNYLLPLHFIHSTSYTNFLIELEFEKE